MVVTESTFNNDHHCWTQNGPSKHGNNGCKLDKTKSCLILKQRGASYWKHVCLVTPRHPTRMGLDHVFQVKKRKRGVSG